jgi:hypothetical protein
VGLLSEIQEVNARGYTLTLEQVLHGDSLTWAVVLKGNNTRIHRAGAFKTLTEAVIYIYDYVKGMP